MEKYTFIGVTAASASLTCQSITSHKRVTIKLIVLDAFLILIVSAIRRLFIPLPPKSTVVDVETIEEDDD